MSGQLNHHQFFHGAPNPIYDDFVRPGSLVGKANYDYDMMAPLESGNSRNDAVFMAGPQVDPWGDLPELDPETESESAEREAWNWANTAGAGRATVYAVDPSYPQPDPHFGHNHWTTDDAAPIVDRIDIAPPDIAPAGTFPRQGTLPPQNWTTYAPKLNAEDANHPFLVDVVDRDQRVAKRQEPETSQEYLRRRGRPEMWTQPELF